MAKPTIFSYDPSAGSDITRTLVYVQSFLELKRKDLVEKRDPEKRWQDGFIRETKPDTRVISTTFNNAVVEFTFNGVKIHVAADSDLALIYRDWNRMLQRSEEKGDPISIVGPYPEETLSDEEVALDKQIAARNKAAHEAWQAEYRAKEEAKKAAVLADIEGQTFEIRPGLEAHYAKYVEVNSRDPYGRGIVEFADAWARRMQHYMYAGDEEKAFSEQLGYDTDYWGMSGFSAGMAKSGIRIFWKHGDKFGEVNGAPDKFDLEAYLEANPIETYLEEAAEEAE